MNILELKRYDLYPYLINKMECKIGIEVGVREGYHSKNLLEKTSIYLYGVDIKNDERASLVFNTYSNRSKYIIGDSVNVSTIFENESLDFIHIDADHHYENVLNDLNAWYPKLKTKGIFSGDDYQIMWSVAEGTFGIVSAVEEFICDKNIELNITKLGAVSKTERLKYAKEIGYKIESNLIIGMSKYYYVEPNLLRDRQEHDNVEPIQWWFIK